MKAINRLERAIEMVKQREPLIQAFTFLPESYQPVSPGLPLSGLPVAVKDLIDTEDMPTSYGCPLFTEHFPPQDAWIVQQLKKMGAIVLGKTTTTEFAWRHATATKNPWHLEHTPGGSSSGSAAAVAAGMVDIALGTQTVGSIIRPAAYCGVVGFKPTYGVLPTTGIHPLAHSLDHLGFIVADCQYASLCHQVLIEQRAEIRAPATVMPKKISLYLPKQWRDVEPELKAHYFEIVTLLESYGIECQRLESSNLSEQWLAALEIILAYEANQCLSPDVGEQRERVGKETIDLIVQGRSIPEAEYQQALMLLADSREQRDNYFPESDAILSLAAPGVAPAGLTYTGDASFCAPWTFLGLPAITLPTGCTNGGLPMGMQLVGHAFGETELISFALWLESKLPCISAPINRRDLFIEY